MTIREFAKIYRKLVINCKETLASIKDTFQDIYIPQITEIINDIKAKDIDEYRETLLDLRDYYNMHYDDQDPDEAALLKEIEELLYFINN